MSWGALLPVRIHCGRIPHTQRSRWRNEEDAAMRTNYPAVVVCAIVYWLLGGLWFDRLFSKQWMALEHVSEAQASSANPVWIWPFILTFLLNLLIAFVLAQLCIRRNANTAPHGAA